MKYRIKIVTYISGRIGYFAQVRKWWGWTYLHSDGDEADYKIEQQSRKAALDSIDMNYKGNKKTQSIVFEYIIKPKNNVKSIR